MTEKNSQTLTADEALSDLGPNDVPDPVPDPEIMTRVSMWLDDYRRNEADDLEDGELAKLDGLAEFRIDDVEYLVATICKLSRAALNQGQG